MSGGVVGGVQFSGTSKVLFVGRRSRLTNLRHCLGFKCLSQECIVETGFQCFSSHCVVIFGARSFPEQSERSQGLFRLMVKASRNSSAGILLPINWCFAHTFVCQCLKIYRIEGSVLWCSATF